MIHIEKYFNNQDRKALYKLLANKKQGKKGAKKSILEDLIERKSVHSFRQDLYANQCVQDKLLEFFHGKCAYCEDFRGNQRKEDGKPDWDWQTEHFRPKAGVSEEGKTHHGYYWLGYECTNFLIGCYTCNKQYKGTQFPIMSGTTRLKVDHFIENGRLETNSCSIFHDLFKMEEPVLINPVIDNPQTFIEFFADGTVKGKNFRGEESIKIYGLDRTLLVVARKKIIDDIIINIDLNLELCERNIDKQLFINIINRYLISLIKEIDEPTRQRQEILLLKQIKAMIPASVVRRFKVLQKKQHFQPLSPLEQDEMFVLIDFMENKSAERVYLLGALAKLRQIPVTELVQQLNLKHFHG